MSELSDLRDIHYKGISNHDLDLAASVFADDVVTVTPQGPMEGLAAFRQFGEVFLSMAPDAQIAVDTSFEDGDTIITEGHFAGTHTGPFATPNGPIPPTGKSFSFPFMDLMKVTNGKVVEHRIYWDNMGFMAQLGLLPE